LNDLHWKTAIRLLVSGCVLYLVFGVIISWLFLRAIKANEVVPIEQITAEDIDKHLLH
jgi:hypothetical protein